MQDGSSHQTEPLLNSTLSFRPLMAALRKNVSEGNPGMQKLYGQVIRELEAKPELLENITDLNSLIPHAELIEELLSAVFPPTTANYMYGVSYPFKLFAVYASPLFQEKLIRPGTNEIIFPESEYGSALREQRLLFAYSLVLKKYLGYTTSDVYRLVYSYCDEITGLIRFMELRLDGRFIDVKPKGEMPKMPESILDKQTNRILTVQELMQLIPLDEFLFEGITVMRVNDVTEQEVINQMKNRLIKSNTISDAILHSQLEADIQSLIGMKDLSIGITPFFKINGHYVYSDLHNTNSFLFRSILSVVGKDEISDYCKLLFRDNNQAILFESLEEEMASDVQFLPYYYKEGGRSVILCPLKIQKDMIGMLEVISKVPHQLSPTHINKLEAAIPLFTLGLEKSLEQLNNQVDKVIKKKFTAVQPAVEWKFTEAALNYIVNKSNDDDARIERITFNDVFPLYGSIDIRNSSTERVKSIQADMIEQLNLAKSVIEKAATVNPYPALLETSQKVNDYLAAASGVLHSETEIAIQDFMHGPMNTVLNHLLSSEPAVKVETEEYFALLDPQLGMLYKYRKEYESSISRINDTLARFIDKEQVAAQKVYPHYFERYITDGLEFNIHIGQSITPRKRFDEIYLRNLKMWQLTVLAKASKMTHALEKELSHTLRTTQLILCHSQTLSISFRTEERKFDVDGAYNTRYEIVKKRIDKVKIRDTNERLTQPGKIAIVYTQAKDAAEYTEYIEFLVQKNLVKPGIEKHDLEELQGVVGLKALRVDINFDPIVPQRRSVAFFEIEGRG